METLKTFEEKIEPLLPNKIIQLGILDVYKNIIIDQNKTIEKYINDIKTTTERNTGLVEKLELSLKKTIDVELDLKLVLENKKSLEKQLKSLEEKDKHIEELNNKIKVFEEKDNISNELNNKQLKSLEEKDKHIEELNNKIKVFEEKNKLIIELNNKQLKYYEEAEKSLNEWKNTIKLLKEELLIEKNKNTSLSDTNDKYNKKLITLENNQKKYTDEINNLTTNLKEKDNLNSKMYLFIQEIIIDDFPLFFYDRKLYMISIKKKSTHDGLYIDTDNKISKIVDNINKILTKYANIYYIDTYVKEFMFKEYEEYDSDNRDIINKNRKETNRLVERIKTAYDTLCNQGTTDNNFDKIVDFYDYKRLLVLSLTLSNDIGREYESKIYNLKKEIEQMKTEYKI